LSATICDYEGTSYRARFWEGQGRDYEDLAERAAIRRLLPPTGDRLIDLGAGFGRLASLYEGYRQVILLDYAKSGLREAQNRLGRDGRYTYVVGDIYHLPVRPATCDAALTVRVLHHLADMPTALNGIASLVKPGGTYLLEYANKRNLKAIVRYALRRQEWSPFALPPVEFAPLNFDFHPAWMARQLATAGFRIKSGLAVSHFRHPLFKKAISPARLAKLDAALQRVGAAWKLTPSVFLLTTRSPQQVVQPENRIISNPHPLFRCPTCQGDLAVGEGGALLDCCRCTAQWAVDDGIYDFRTPVRAGHPMNADPTHQ
jgi:SAM-dependent methyltransferase